VGDAERRAENARALVVGHLIEHLVGEAIATDDDGVAQTARALAFHGSRDKETFTYVGYNSRLDALQAAILRVLLPELDGWCDGRRAGARAYLDAGLAGHVTVPVVPDGAIPAWHLYAVTHPRADELLHALAGESWSRAHANADRGMLASEIADAVAIVRPSSR